MQSNEMPQTGQVEKTNAPKPMQESVEEIQRQLRALAARMERAENKLGLSTASAQSPLSITSTQNASSIQASPASAPQASSAAPIKPLTTLLSPALGVLPASPASMSAIPKRAQSFDPLARPTSLNAYSEGAAGSTPGMGTPAPSSTHFPKNDNNLGDALGALRAKVSDVVSQQRVIGDWGNLIGGKWALWVGLFSLFLAMTSFLAYTWKALPPMPPAARMACSVVAGLAFIGASQFFRERAQR